MSFSGVRFELTEEKIQTQKKLYCVSVLNKRSFEPFCVWILFQNASSHSGGCFLLLLFSEENNFECVICPEVTLCS